MFLEFSRTTRFKVFIEKKKDKFKFLNFSSEIINNLIKIIETTFYFSLSANKTNYISRIFQKIIQKIEISFFE